MLVDIFNKSIDQGVFPSSLKLAKVIPLYKKGDYSNPENYRPISLLSSLSKVYEHLLFERMVVFCKKMKYCHQSSLVSEKKCPVLMQLSQSLSI